MSEVDPLDPAWLINLCHEQIHAAENDPEDAVFMTLTRRDCWVICLGGLLIEGAFPCIEEETDGVLERLVELIDCQKPHWRDPRHGD